MWNFSFNFNAHELIASELTFLYCILQPCWIHLVDVGIFFPPYILMSFAKSDNFIAFLFISLILFPFLALLYWLKLPPLASAVLSKSGESRHQQSLPILGEKHSVNCRILYKCCLLSWGSTLPSLFFGRFLSWSGVEFCQMLFLHQSSWWCDFFCPLHSVNVVYYIY